MKKALDKVKSLKKVDEMPFKYKRLIFIISLFGFVGITMYFILVNDSARYYAEAEKLFNNKDYFGAKAAIDKALEENRYNRKAIGLMAKVNVIIRGENDYERAKQLYDKGIAEYEKGEIETAKATFRRSLDILINISTSSPARSKAEDLIRMMQKYFMQMEKRGPAKLVDKAKDLINSGKYMQAFNELEQMPDSAEVRKMKSEAAYIIGTERFERVIRRKNSGVTDIEINDALYWLKSIHDGSMDYRSAQLMIKELENLKKQ